MEGDIEFESGGSVKLDAGAASFVPGIVSSAPNVAPARDRPWAVVIEPGGIWPALPMTMRHTKGGQTEVVVTWGEMRTSVILRYDTGT